MVSPGNDGSNRVSFSSSTIGPVTLNISCSRGSDASFRHFSSNSATESNSHSSRYSCASPTKLRQMPQNLNPCSRINGSVRSANVRSYSATWCARNLYEIFSSTIFDCGLRVVDTQNFAYLPPSIKNQKDCPFWTTLSIASAKMSTSRRVL